MKAAEKNAKRRVHYNHRKIGVMWMNHEGYRDPTADRAVRKADKMPKHIRKIFDALNTVVSVQGIKVTEITDKHTGRKWKL